MFATNYIIKVGILALLPTFKKVPNVNQKDLLNPVEVFDNTIPKEAFEIGYSYEDDCIIFVSKSASLLSYDLKTQKTDTLKKNIFFDGNVYFLHKSDSSMKIAYGSEIDIDFDILSGKGFESRKTTHGNIIFATENVFIADYTEILERYRKICIYKNNDSIKTDTSIPVESFFVGLNQDNNIVYAVHKNDILYIYKNTPSTTLIKKIKSKSPSVFSSSRKGLIIKDKQQGFFYLNYETNHLYPINIRINAYEYTIRGDENHYIICSNKYIYKFIY